MLSRRFASLLFCSLALAPACGSRSALDGAGDPTSEGGAGGSTTTSGTTSSSTTGSTSTTSTTGTTPFCGAVAVQDTFVINPGAQARRPQLAAYKTKASVLMGAISTDLPTEWLSFVELTDPWTTWPPGVKGQVGQLAYGVSDFVMSTGPKGPLAIVGVGPVDPTPALLQFDEASISYDSFGSLGSGEFLYVAGVQDRTLAAQRNIAGPYDTLQIGSYQTGGLPQSEEPLVCLQSPVLAAAVPAGTGFLSAVAEAEDPDDNCLSVNPSKGTRLAMKRYESPKEPGSFLQLTEGESFSDAEAVHLLTMSTASFGAWVVLQRDGSTSEQMPAIQAFPVDMKGYLLSGSLGPFAVSPDGVDYPAVAAATLAGDLLAVAHVDNLDPSAQAIVIQLARADGSLGPTIAIPTNEAWLTGRVEMLASPDGHSLLITWESAQPEQRIALTRVDCLGL